MRVRLFRGFAFVALALAVAGCAARPRVEPVIALTDPHERQNRAALEATRAIAAALRPADGAADGLLPEPVRERLRSATDNLTEPRVFANNVLQGRVEAAGITAGRFVFNSTLGVAGLFDVAAQGGLRRQSGDFGQTLFAWGVDSGPYLVLPLLGPTTVRDGFGSLVDLAGDPTSWVLLTTLGTPTVRVITGVAAVVARIDQVRQLDDVEDTSLDFYVRLRSFWEQNRAAELREAVGLDPAGGSPLPPLEGE